MNQVDFGGFRSHPPPNHPLHSLTHSWPAPRRSRPQTVELLPFRFGYSTASQVGRTALGVGATVPSVCSSLPGSQSLFPAVSMSAVMAEGCFLSALQPNSSCTAYVVPSDGPSPDPVAKARRVREQVRMRLAEKKSLSLPRLDDSLVGPTGEPSTLQL